MRYSFAPGEYRANIKSAFKKPKDSETYYKYSNNYIFKVESNPNYYYFSINPNIIVDNSDYAKEGDGFVRITLVEDGTLAPPSINING